MLGQLSDLHAVILQKWSADDSYLFLQVLEFSLESLYLRVADLKAVYTGGQIGWRVPLVTRSE